MRKRNLCILLIILALSLSLFACGEESVNSDKPVIADNTFRIGMLLSSKESTSSDIEAGFNYAYSLANTVNLNESVSVDCSTVYYNDSSDVEYFAESLVTDGVSAIVFGNSDYESFAVFAEYIGNIKVPVISLNPYFAESDNIYTLSLNPKYMSSCAATYAMEKGYNACAVLLESSDKYCTDFAETYKSTLKNYIGVEPTVYYKNGELANYSSSALSGGNYDFLFLISSQQNRESFISELRNSGFTGEIMLTEILDKASVKSEAFNNCSFISKLEQDSSNNVSTVFYSMYSEYSGVSEADISPAVAYGYDAYMTAFEALKSFAPESSSSIFANNDAIEASTESKLTEIKMSDFRKAIGDVAYFGVTDTVTFKENTVVPTYIYVDNIINSEILFNSKYTFNADLNSAK